MTKNIILNSLKQSFALIWKNKSLFVLLFIMQITFFFIFSLISYKYVPKMIESQKSIFDYLAKQKLDEISVAQNIMQQKSILGDDPLMISRNFNEIIKNFRLYLVYIFLLLIAFMSISWAITNKLVYNINLKKLSKYLFKILIILLFYLGLIFTFFYSLLNISFTRIAVGASQIFTKYIPFLIFSIILVYFMFVSLSLLHKTDLKNIMQKTLFLGIKKAHYVASVYLINLFLFALSIFLLYNFIEKSILVLLPSLLLMIFSFVFGRIFVVNVIERLS